MTGAVWVLLGTADAALLAEADRLATELGEATDDRPRVSAIRFRSGDGTADDGDGGDDGDYSDDHNDGSGDHNDDSGDRLPAPGADELVVIDSVDGEFREGAVDVPQRVEALADLAEERPPDLALFPSTPDGDLTAARFARRVDGGCRTDCLLRVRDGELRAGRQSFGERAVVEVSFQAGPVVASLHTDVLEPDPSAPATEPTVVEFDVDLPDAEGIRRHAVLDRPEEDLSRANVVVAGGHGLDGPDGFDVVEALADALGATVGASRPPVDDGWVTYDRQIGVTGAEIDAELYVPCAISGDPYHVRSVGAEHLVPINTDPDAAIFESADIGVVGDVYEYGPALASAIADATAASEGDP